MMEDILAIFLLMIEPERHIQLWQCVALCIPMLCFQGRGLLSINAILLKLVLFRSRRTEQLIAQLLHFVPLAASGLHFPFCYTTRWQKGGNNRL